MLSVIAVALVGGALILMGDTREGVGVFLGAAVVAAAETAAYHVRQYFDRSPRP